MHNLQPILNYIDNDSYSWTAATVSKVPNVNGDDLLYDSYHSYDRTLFQQPYGVLNCSTAYGAKESASKSQKGTQYTSIQSSSSTYSTIIEAGDLAKKLNWAGIRIKNASGSKVSADNYKIYKINDDGTESEVLNLKSTDDSRKINVYNLSNKLAKEITVPSDSYLYLANAFFTSIPIRIIAT